MIAIHQLEIKSAIFVQRDNRFLATVNIDGTDHKAHVPNSGRMLELLTAGAKVGLIIKNGANRKTKYQLTWVLKGGIWVNIDSSMPNKIMVDAINGGLIPQLRKYQLVGQEVNVGDSRLDLLLADQKADKLLYVETKSVTLVDNGVAMFPDAPTARGSKHLQQLIKLAEEGNESAIIFIIQRKDAKIFKPNKATDPHFSKWLQEASAKNVKLLAYSCNVELGKMEIKQSIPVTL